MSGSLAGNPHLKRRFEAEIPVSGSLSANNPKDRGQTETDRLSERLAKRFCGDKDNTSDFTNKDERLGYARTDAETLKTLANVGPQATSSISNSQITANGDVNVYTIGTVVVHSYGRQGIKSEADSDGSEICGTGNKPVVNEDYVASGMQIPSLPVCVVEREAQHQQIVTQLLTVPDARVVILGMGGIGKTTLACSAARDSRIIHAYPRRLFVSFEGSSTPDLAFTSLANVFQIPSSRRNSHAEILTHILSYLKLVKTLLIIDNFETFWEVSANRRTADDFLGQLASLPSTAIIVTLRGSQRPSNIGWMRMDPLQTLTLDASQDLLATVAQGQYSHNEDENVHHLLGAVAGIPLAVTLIGFLLRDQSETPQSLWRRWSQESTRALAIDPDSDDRLYRLDVSLRLTIFGARMKDSTRDFLAAISLLPTGLSLEEEWLDELQHLLQSTTNIRDCIRTLRNVALATSDPPTSPSSSTRLRLLTPVRDFCVHNLSLDNKVIRRLIDIYCTKMKDISRYDSDTNYSWFTREMGNLTAIFNHALEIGYITDDLGYMAARYTRWLRFLGMPSTDLVERMGDILPQNSAPIASCLQAYGDTLQYMKQNSKAILKLERALLIHRGLGLVKDMGWDLLYLGNIQNNEGNLDSTEHSFSEALDLFTRANDSPGKAAALQSLSDVFYLQKRFTDAETKAIESLECSRASHNRFREANALITLGRIYLSQRKSDSAVEKLTAARSLSEDINHTVGQANANRSLACAYRDVRKLDQAAQYFQEAIFLFEKAQCLKEAEEVRTDFQVFQKQRVGTDNSSYN